jgi:TolB-like protein/class 3 adenylate cyclase/Flp pilus assembly protein TadD
VQQAETRKLAAIMFTDIVGFSRQMGADEIRMLRLLEVHNRLIHQAVSEHHGTVIKTIGDAFLVDFPSVVHAVQCAQSIQAQLRTHNVEKENTEQIHVRIGIHSGDIVQKNGDVFGDGVNIASRLQSLAEPDTICLSQVVYQEVSKKLDLGTVVSLGKPKLKNIAERFQVYALLLEAPKGLRQTLRVQHLKLSRRLRPVVFVFVSVSVALGAGLIAVWYRPFLIPNTQHASRNTPQSLPLPDKPSIVVLPFTNMSDDPKQEYFSDGITEDLTSDLSKISSLFVIARNSAFTYKGKAVKVQEVSKEMGVRYVLEGSVRKSDNQVRVTAQLIDATTGEHLWSERYNRPLQDIFAVQDEIVQQVGATLRVEIVEAELERVRRIPTNNLTAYDSLLRGVEYFYRFTKETNAQARQMYEQAIELDPRYALAYAFLGFTHWTDFTFQWSQDPHSLERAFALAQQAIALDDSEPYVHMLLGAVYLRQKRFDEAVAEAKQAVTLDPNNADAYVRLAENLSTAGRPAEALGFMQQAIRLNPRHSVWYLFNLGLAYHLTGQYTEALAALEKARTRNPNFLATHLNLVLLYSKLGREKEARAEAEEVLRINPNFSLETWTQNAPYKDPVDLERLLAALRKAGLK